MLKRNLNINLRDELAELSKESAYEVLVQKTSRKIRCSCFNEKYSEPDPKCPKCIGTGWLFKFERQKAFKQSASAGVSGNVLIAEIGMVASGYSTFFFQHDAQIDEKDYIWEVAWKENKPIKLMNLYKAEGVEKKRGETGSIQYKVVMAKKESLDKDFKGMYIGKAWRDLK